MARLRNVATGAVVNVSDERAKTMTGTDWESAEEKSSESKTTAKKSSSKSTKK